MNESQVMSVPIPDVVVRQVGMLQLQLAVAQERILELETENGALRDSLNASLPNHAPHPQQLDEVGT